MNETPPDLILNVVDANNLARNFALTTQLMEQGLPVVIALNMLDELEKQGHTVDLDELSRGLAKPVIGSDGRNNSHIPALLNLLLANVDRQSEVLEITYEPHLEEAVVSLEENS